jgi:exopolysaccharide biosynthesis polyprenyl glycosylphosphotransferase
MYNSLLSLVFINIAVITAGYFLKESKIPYQIFILSFFISIFSFSLQKKLMFNWYSKLHTKEKTAVIGMTEDGEIIAGKLIRHLKHLYDVGYILDAHKISFEEMKEYISKCKAVFLSENIKETIKEDIMVYCYQNSVTAYSIPMTTSIFKNAAYFTTLDDIPLLRYKNTLSPEDLMLKRIIDIWLASTGLILASPLLLIGCIGIKLQDKGSVFFKQKRLTVDNREFDVLKLRTMIVDAEKNTGAVLASQKDPRITKFGEFLRSTRIDEIPQLINVLKGDMSIVGPRPERPEIADIYTKEYKDFALRTKMKAGITGMAQVWGKYNTTYRDKLMFDLYYINNYSIFLDLQILFYTFKIIFMKSSTEGIGEQTPLSEIVEANKLELNTLCKGVKEIIYSDKKAR